MGRCGAAVLLHHVPRLCSTVRPGVLYHQSICAVSFKWDSVVSMFPHTWCTHTRTCTHTYTLVHTQREIHRPLNTSTHAHACTSTPQEILSIASINPTPQMWFTCPPPYLAATTASSTAAKPPCRATIPRSYRPSGPTTLSLQCTPPRVCPWLVGLCVSAASAPLACCTSWSWGVERCWAVCGCPRRCSPRQWCGRVALRRSAGTTRCMLWTLSLGCLDAVLTLEWARWMISSTCALL